MDKKYVLITGAAGFIGMHICKKLLELNYVVIGYDNVNPYYSTQLKEDRLNELLLYPNFFMYRCSLEDKLSLFAVFQKHKIDIVINLAAQAGVRYSIENPDIYIQSNIVGFLNILEACRNFNINHLLYASSSSVYGANTKLPFSVGDTTDAPVSLYAATKKSNELMAYSYSHLYNIHTTGLRFFTVYGEWGRPDMAPFLFTDSIINNRPIKVFNNGQLKRDFTYIDDIVNGIVLLLDRIKTPAFDIPKYQIYNIGNNVSVKLMDFIITLEDCIGKSAIKEFLPMQKGDVFETYANIDNFSQDTGFYPTTDIKIGIQKYVNWHKKYYIV